MKEKLELYLQVIKTGQMAYYAMEYYRQVVQASAEGCSAEDIFAMLQSITVDTFTAGYVAGAMSAGAFLLDDRADAERLADTLKDTAVSSFMDEGDISETVQ